jgi:hypothetical protein
MRKQSGGSTKYEKTEYEKAQALRELLDPPDKPTVQRGTDPNKKRGNFTLQPYSNHKGERTTMLPPVTYTVTFNTKTKRCILSSDDASTPEILKNIAFTKDIRGGHTDMKNPFKKDDKPHKIYIEKEYPRQILRFNRQMDCQAFLNFIGYTRPAVKVEV